MIFDPENVFLIAEFFDPPFLTFSHVMSSAIRADGDKKDKFLSLALSLL